MPIPVVNGIVYTLPPSPLLTQHHQVPTNVFCDLKQLSKIDCRASYCSCVYKEKINLGDATEFVVVNIGNDTGYHTFHLHGHSFQVLDEQGKVERKLNGTVTKDTVMIPFGGYTILRFIADNPGMWLFHCHMDWNFANGMGLIMQVGETKDFTNPPKHFPTCGDFSF
ncbi:hypothetical protein CHUAL_011999 [Chamberlinius hualienensis]